MMTIQDWLNKWDGSQGDIQNILNFLNEYVSDANVAGTLIYASARGLASKTNTHIADVKKAILAIETLHSTNNSNSSRAVYIPIEYVLACIKQEIHNYQGYRFVFDKGAYSGYCSSEKNATRNPEPNEFLIVHSDSSKVKYTVISPNNKIVLGIFSCAQLRPDWSCFKREKDMMPYTAQILDIASRRGHTRGSHIHATDDLASLLKVIEIKTGIDYFKLDHIDILDNYKNLNMFSSGSDSSLWKKQGDFAQQIQHDSLKRATYYINTSPSNRIISSIQLLRYNNDKLALKITASNQTAFAQIEHGIITRELPAPTGCSIVVDSLDLAESAGRKNCYELDINSPIRCGQDAYAPNNWSYFQYRDASGVKTPVKINNPDTFKTVFPWFAVVDGSDMKLNLTNSQMGKLIPLIDHTPPAFGRSKTNEYILYVADSSVENRNILGRLLALILDVDPSAMDVVKELADLLDIQVAITDAIEAQTNKIYHPIWDLALDFKEDFFSESPITGITLEKLIQIFTSISVNNPHYAEATYELSQLTLRLDHNEANDYSFLQQQFRYAFKSNNQEYIDTVYNKLCGCDSMSSEKITGINGDVNILISLAAQLHRANKKIDLLSTAQINNNSNSDSTHTTSTYLASNPNSLFLTRGQAQQQTSLYESRHTI